MDNLQLAKEAVRVLNDKKGIDIKVIDVSEKSSLADYMIIVSGGNDRQVGALADAVEDKFEELGLSPKSIAGPHRSGWILMDFGDIIVNVFNPELRERYNLESVWGDCSFLEFEE